MTHSLSVAKDLYFRSSDAYLRMIISIRKILEECEAVLGQWGSHGGEDDDVFFWAVTPCRLVGRYQRFGETYCLLLQGWNQQDNIVRTLTI
jgi:hypothetical protein